MDRMKIGYEELKDQPAEVLAVFRAFVAGEERAQAATRERANNQQETRVVGTRQGALG